MFYIEVAHLNPLIKIFIMCVNSKHSDSDETIDLNKRTEMLIKLMTRHDMK